MKNSKKTANEKRTRKKNGEKLKLGIILSIFLLMSGSLFSVKGEELVIGVLGVMSGPAAQWGRINRNCAEVTAALYNEEGGVEIEKQRYFIRLLIRDTEMNPEKAEQGARELIDAGVRYIIGPNRDDTSRAIVPDLELKGAINIFYTSSIYLLQPPRSNSIMGMRPSSQSAPVMFRYLRDYQNVRSVGLVPFMDQDSMQQRNINERAALDLGLEVRHVDSFDFKNTYFGNNLSNAREVMKNMINEQPDLITFPGALPDDLPRLVGLARAEGFSGVLGATAAHEPARLIAIGEAANGLYFLGGNPPEDSWSPYKREFVRRYRALAGEWHDEAGTKAYAMEILLRTLQKAGKRAIEDVEVFKKTMEGFSTQDPFLRKSRPLTYLDSGNFGQRRQINVPLLINSIQDNKVKTMHIN
ncbi:MAG: ABC transporter substrate-binding protein [SAR324 cluster bacterium]|nr:ABC transporter substrate-binding protein [SAR324 cluster bacterium]